LWRSTIGPRWSTHKLRGRSTPAAFEIILDCDQRNVTLRGQEQPAATEERTPSSTAVPGSKQSQGLAALSEEDLAMVKELLVAGSSARADRDWGSATRKAGLRSTI
jgi:hypothetical protein